jgi:hypothetical protein
MQGAENRTKTLIILILIVIIGIIYSLSIFIAYPEFQNARLIDPLAEINSLFPLYYVAIALTALLGLGCFIWRIQNRYLHILLLEMFAVMLWFTPYGLAGFVRTHDSLWHVGIAMKLPQVLAGDPVAFSDYALAYPGSYIFNYSFLNIVGIDPVGYMGTFYPLLFTLLFVLMFYLFLSRLFSEKVALLSTLIAIPGLHYIEIHPSPHSVGSLLMLTALLLLTRRGATAKIMAVIAITVIIISHPVTPLVLSAFLAAALLTNIVYYRRIGRAQLTLASVFIFTLLGWFFWWAFYSPVPSEERIDILYQFMKLGEMEVSGLIGAPFMYENIQYLKRGVYVLYAVAATLGILYTAARAYPQDKRIGSILSKFGGLSRGEALMALIVLLLIPLTFLMAVIDPLLLERGLTFIILALSCIIASIIGRFYRSRISERTINSVVMVGVLFLTLSFPIVAYSDAAWRSIPVSQGAGLEFLGSEVPLEGKGVAMAGYNILALHAKTDLSETRFGGFRPRQEDPIDFTKIQPDIVVFHITSYYYNAMRYDISFEDNLYTRSIDIIEGRAYDKIYSSPTFKIYHKSEVYW